MALDTRIICSLDALQECGRAVSFAREFDGHVEACFAIRFHGKPLAYVNRCPHRGTPLDWQPGEVFDNSGLYLICATHGAAFEPDTGLCVDGPCLGATLTKVEVVGVGRELHLAAGRLTFRDDQGQT